MGYIHGLTASVSAVLWNHLNTWELFVVHSVVPCLVTHPHFLSHFYIMSIISVAFREKTKINVLSLTVILKLNLPHNFFFFSYQEFLHHPAISVIMEGKGSET